jgi:hypothetical protein
MVFALVCMFVCASVCVCVCVCVCVSSTMLHREKGVGSVVSIISPARVIAPLHDVVPQLRTVAAENEVLNRQVGVLFAAPTPLPQTERVLPWRR